MRKTLLSFIFCCFQLIEVTLTSNTSCDFTKELQCGDVCTGVRKLCYCGYDHFHVYVDEKHCCLSSMSNDAQCYLDGDGHGHCSSGSPVPLNQTCNGKCYNDYNQRDTTKLGPVSNFRCNSGDQCVPAMDICQGYSLCEDKSDVTACNANLTCSRSLDNRRGFKKYALSAEIAPEHHYCRYHFTDNDGLYDSIGREDETNLNVFIKVKHLHYQHYQHLHINYSQLVDCSSEDGKVGILCGDTCVLNHHWCRHETVFSCGSGEDTFSTWDSSLCGNGTFWRNKSCFQHFSGGNEVATFGLRCFGSKQHCYNPWYLTQVDYYEKWHTSLKQNCEDFSDQIFQVNAICNITNYVNKYKDLFCSKMSNTSSDKLCEDSESWISVHIDPGYADPHNCYGSCSDPGLGCTACSNPKYFKCKRNNMKVCLHPQLKCDGHPQCDQAEDEDVDQCYQDYLEKGIITKYATYKCKSIMYPNMITVATVCNGEVECQDREDEPTSCEDQTIEKMIFFSVLSAPVLYIYLKNICNWLLKRNTGKNNPKAFGKKSVLLIFKELEDRKDDEGFFDLVNSYLIFKNFTCDFDLRRKISFQFHEYLWMKSGSKEEFYCTLHNNIMPEVAEMIIDSKRTLHCGEKYYLKVLDKIKRNRMLYFIKCTLMSLTSFALHYSDKLKDIFLCGKIYILNGGILSLWNFPTHFSSMIVFCLSFTIVLPLILGNILLVKQNYKTIYRKWNIKLTPVRKTLMKIGVLVTAVFNPILLRNSYENAKEETRKASKEFNTEIAKLLKVESQLKYQHVEFIKLDLSLESFYQTIIQLVLVFLSRTETPTTEGLKVLFDMDYGTMEYANRVHPHNFCSNELEKLYITTFETN